MKIKGAFPVRWAPEPGKDGTGVTIRTSSTKYAASTSGTIHPTSGWQTSVPSVADGNYLWTWVHVEYSDGTTTDSYSVARMGIDGKGIKSSTVTYSQQQNSVNPATITNWGAFPSTLTEGWWLYTKTHVVYSDNESTDSYSVSQVGVGAYFAGTAEYYAAGASADVCPEGAATAGTYANEQTIQTTWKQERPTLNTSTPYLWNFSISADSRGNKYVTDAICIGNFAKGITSIVETYAISAYGTPDNGGSYPSDIASADWKDEQHAAVPTEAKRYQWNKTETTYNDGSKEYHYHVSAVKGLDGKGATYLDLDNENDSMLFDGQGNLIGGTAGYLTSNIFLYSNGERVKNSPTFSIQSKSSTVSASVSGNVLSVTNITSNTGFVIVQCVYNNVTYTARMTIKRIAGVDKYELVLNHNAVSYNETQGVLSNTSINVEVYRTAQNGSRTKVTTMSTYGLTAKLYPNGMSANAQSISFNTSGNGTSTITADNAASWNNFAIVLFKSDTEVDRETVPINKAKDGETGPGAVILDLDNENDCMLYDGAGMLMSGSVVSQGKLLVGGEDKTSEVTAWELKDKSYVTGSIDTSGKINITGVSATSGSAVAYATYGGKQYTAKITIKKLVGVDKFEIVCTPNAFTYNTTKATNAAQTINVKVYRTGQNGVRTIVSKLATYGLTLRYYIDNGGPIKITDGTDIGEYNSGASRTISANLYGAYRYELLDKNNVMLDVETVPISKNSDGEGKDAFILDLDNENDSMLYDGSDSIISDPVVSTGSLYKGPTKVTSGITWSIASADGVTLMNSGKSTNTNYARSSYPTAAWINSSGLVTVNGMTASQGKVVVRATYGGNTYDATLTLKKLRGVDKYELVLSPAALTHNSTTNLVNGSSSVNVTAQIWRTAQNGERAMVTDFNGTNKYGLSIEVTPSSITLTKYSYGVQIPVSNTIANGYSGVTVVLKKGAQTLDSETIPIAKTTNGSGSPGPAAKAIYKLSFAKPATPTGTNPQNDPSKGEGVLAWADDPKMQDEVQITQQGDWYLDSDGFMRAPAIGSYESSIQTLNFVTTANNQKIYLRVKCTTGSVSYVRIGVLDNVAPASNYIRSVSGSNQDTGDIEVNVPTAGVHFICIYYYRDYYTDSYVKFACGKMSVWQSNVKTYNSAGVITEWSTPFKVGSDSESTEVQTRANLLKQTAFLASNMDAWIIRNGSTTEGKDGRNGYKVANNTSSENYMEILKQVIYDPDGDKQLLPDTWYTLSFWVKLVSYNNSYGTKMTSYIYPENINQSDTCAVEVTAGRIVDGVAYGTTTPTDCNYTWKVTSQWVRHSITFKTRKSGIPSEKQMVLFRLPISSNGVVICMPKLEQGTVATAYVTNENDMVDLAAEGTGFPNDRNVWVESPDEPYVWNETRRDYVAHVIDGTWYRFFVKRKSMTVPNGTAPTAGGNSYWEQGNVISTLLSNTIIGTNCKIGGFLASAMMLKSANEKLILNGVAGIIQMYHDDGYTWQVLDDGRQVLGNYTDDNNKGEHIQLDPSNKEIRVYEGNGSCVTTISGIKIPYNELFGDSTGSLTLDSYNKSGSAYASNSSSKASTQICADTKTICDFQTKSATRLTFGGSASATGSRTLVNTEISPGDANNGNQGIVPPQYILDGNGNYNIDNIAQVIVRINTYSDSGRTSLISTKTVANANSAQSTSGYGTKTVSLDGITIDLPAGYHRLEVYVYCVVYAGQTTTTSVSCSWNVTSATYVSDIYLSRLFANGVAYGSSLNNFFAAMNQDGKMLVKGVTMKGSGSSARQNGFELSNNGLSIIHAGKLISPVITLGRGRITCSGTSSSSSDSVPDFVNGIRGATDSVTVTRAEQGIHRIDYPASWKALNLVANRIIVHIDSYLYSSSHNRRSGVASVGYITSSYCTFAVGENNTPSDAWDAYFEIKYMLP